MSLANRIESLVERVAQEFNDVRQKSGNLANLQTANKTSLVAAINELKTALVTVGAIDDTQVTTTSSYSSAKIVALLDDLKAQIVGGADATCDTLGEIQRILQDGTSGLQALAGAVSNRVRVDAPQPLTAAQQWQARQNIGAADGAQIGDTQTDFVGIFQGALR